MNRAALALFALVGSSTYLAAAAAAQYASPAYGGEGEVPVEAPTPAPEAGRGGPAPAPPPGGWRGGGPHPTPAPEPGPAPPGMPRPREPFRWWKDSRLAAELQLTSAQVQRLEQSFLDFRLQLIDLRAELERQEARFGVLIEVDDLDLAAASRQAGEVARARAELERVTTVMLLTLRRELSPAQWQILQRHERQRAPVAPTPPPPR